MKRSHIPLRTCIGCRQVKPKQNVLRIVLDDQGIFTPDGKQRLPGRGMYLCNSIDCLQRISWKNVLKEHSKSEVFIGRCISAVSTFVNEQRVKG